MRIPSDIEEDILDLLLDAKPVPVDLLPETNDLWRQQTNYGRTPARRAPPVDRKDYPTLLRYHPRATDRDLMLKYQLSALPDADGATFHAYLFNIPCPGTLFLARTWTLPAGTDGDGVGRRATPGGRKCDAASPADYEDFQAALQWLRRTRNASAQWKADRQEGT